MLWRLRRLKRLHIFNMGLFVAAPNEEKFEAAAPLSSSIAGHRQR